MNNTPCVARFEVSGTPSTTEEMEESKKVIEDVAAGLAVYGAYCRDCEKWSEADKGVVGDGDWRDPVCHSKFLATRVTTEKKDAY